MQMGISVCETKKFFDTEFEASLAAAKITKVEYIPYKCGYHWHLTHADPDKRQGYGGGKKYKRCDKCRDIFTARQFEKHECEVIE